MQRTPRSASGWSLFHLLLWHRPIPRTGHAAAIYDEFGQRLCLLASALSDEPELADQLVIQSIMAHEAEPSSLQELSAGIYIAWLAWGRPPLSGRTHLEADASPTAPMIVEIRDLADDQRAALALCKYGGHTYRGAAKILDLAPERVASLLGDALRRLGAPGETRELTVGA